jgi:hypothetical protein
MLNNRRKLRENTGFILLELEYYKRKLKLIIKKYGLTKEQTKYKNLKD